MFPLKSIGELEHILKTTNLKLVTLSKINLHKYDGNQKDKFLFELHKIRVERYLSLLQSRGLEIVKLVCPFNLYYVPKKTRKIIDFAKKYHSFYSQFQKLNKDLTKIKNETN